MRPAIKLLLITAIALVPDRAQAQTAYSIDVGAITAFEDATLQIGFRAAPSVANKGGADILFATFPDALIHGFMLFTLDVDATYGTPLGQQFTLYPRVGGSILAGGGGSSGGGGAAFGYNAVVPGPFRSRVSASGSSGCASSGNGCLSARVSFRRVQCVPAFFYSPSWPARPRALPSADRSPIAWRTRRRATSPARRANP